MTPVLMQPNRTRRSNALALSVLTFAASVVAALVIYLTHPVDPDSEGLLVGFAAALWPFLLCPLAIVVCAILIIAEYRRGELRRPTIALLIALLAWPTIFVGYVLSQKPWLAPSSKLKDPWPDVRADGARRLGDKRRPDGIPLLISALKDPDRGVRSEAADALARYGPTATNAIPALTAALDDEDWYVGCEAGEALGSMGGQQQRVLPPLLATLDDPKPYRSWCATKAIGQLGPEAASAVPALLKLIRSEDPNIRSAVCESLGRIGPPAAAAVPQVTAALQDSNQWVRKAASEALPKMKATQ